MIDYPKTRTIRITLDVDLMVFPRDEWDDETMRDEEVSSDWPLEELSPSVVADCIEQGTYDPEIFVGSMLYLKVAETRIISSEIVDDAPSAPVGGSR